MKKSVDVNGVIENIPWTTIFDKALEMMKSVEWGKVVGFRKRQTQINEDQIEFNKQVIERLNKIDPEN